MSDKYCVMQDDMKDCGVSCLLSIIKYYGGYVSKEYLRELTKTSKNGVTALNLIKASKSLGFDAYGIKEKLKNIKSSDLPIIAHVTIDKKFNHFVVIYKIDYKGKKIGFFKTYVGAPACVGSIETSSSTIMSFCVILITLTI